MPGGRPGKRRTPARRRPAEPPSAVLSRRGTAWADYRAGRAFTAVPRLPCFGATEAGAAILLGKYEFETRPNQAGQLRLEKAMSEDVIATCDEIDAEILPVL